MNVLVTGGPSAAHVLPADRSTRSCRPDHTDGSTDLPVNGCWSRRTARRARGRGRSRNRPGAIRPAYDPDCYLCPGNTRAGGSRDARRTRRRSSSTTTSPRCCRTPADGRLESGPGDCSWPKPNAASAGSSASPHATTSPSAAWTLGRHAPRGGHLGRADRRARRHPMGQPRADLREPGRDDGRQQPAPTRPDLGHRTAAQRAGQGDRPAARLRRRWPLPALRLPAGWNYATEAGSCARTTTTWPWCRSGRSGRSKPWFCPDAHHGALPDLDDGASATVSRTSCSA